MPSRGKLAILVRDENTGEVVIPNLPHLHQSTWSEYAMLPGTPGGSALGSCTIPMPPPGSPAFSQTRSALQLLRRGQKLEAYLGDKIAGTPRFSCVLNGIAKNPSAITLSGDDTLWWLQQSQVMPGEQILNSLTPGQLIGNFLGTEEVVLDDALTSLAAYTQTPAARWTTTIDPWWLGLPAFTCSNATSVDNLVVNNTSFSSTFYRPCRIDCCAIVLSGTDTTSGGFLSIVAESDATGANCVYGGANVRQTGAATGIYAVDAKIYSRVAGVSTVVATVANVLTGLNNLVKLQLTMVGYDFGGSYYWRLFINGSDTGCVYSRALAGNLPAGRIGFNWFAVAGGSPTGYAMRLAWRYRNWITGRFVGNLSNGSGSPISSPTGQVNGLTYLDIYSLALATQGWPLRKRAGAGAKADIIDFNAASGVDRSSEYVFSKRNGKLLWIEITDNVDAYGKDLRLAATPGTDSGGVSYWLQLGNAGDIVLKDTVVNAGLNDFAAQVGHVRLIQANKVAPGQAKRIRILRDDKTDALRLLDYVTVSYPELDVVNAKVQLIGTTFTEGSGEQEFITDQLPTEMSDILSRRYLDSTRMIANLYRTR